MADIYTNAELAHYMQRDLTGMNADTIVLHRSLITEKIRLEVGPARFDALADLAGFRPVALEVASRMYPNPGRYRQVGAITYAAETIGPPKLTEDEKREVRQAAGMSSAFSVTPDPS